MSPLAIIVSALFWTWLWGPIGLLLATPLTACLVVLGRYFPAFYICSVLLAAEPPTSAETKLIRFLTESRLPEARALLQELAGMQLSIGIVEELILPTLRAIENDLYPGAGGGATKSRIYAQLRELIEEMTVEIPTEPEQSLGTIDIWTARNHDHAFYGRRRRNYRERYSALAGGRRDRHACAFLANSSRRESGTSEGTEIKLDFALSDRVKIGKHCG